MRMSNAYTAAPYSNTASHAAKLPHWPVNSGTIKTSERTISQRFGRIRLSRKKCKEELYHETDNKATQDAPQR